MDEDDVALARKVLRDGNEVNQMMKVVGEEGTSIDDFILYMKSEYIDSTYLQQNAFIEADAATSVERQNYVFGKLLKVIHTKMKFEDKGQCRSFFQKLSQTCKDWNGTEFQSDEFKKIEEQMTKDARGGFRLCRIKFITGSNRSPATSSW